MCICGDICAYVYQLETVADPEFPMGGACTDDDANANDTNAKDNGQSMIV